MGKLTSKFRSAHLIFIFLATLLLFLISCQQDTTGKIPPKAIDGVLDLTGWNFETDGPIALSGEWEFYWNRHLYSDQFSLPKPPDIISYVEVPECWNDYKNNGDRLPGHGYATYRLRILMKDQTTGLAFDFLDISTAYRIYVDGENIDSVGVAGKSSETTYPGFHRGISEFKSGSKNTEIIFHVSNFHHRLGGLWDTIRLGPEEKIRKLRERSLAVDLFLCGSILIIGLYHVCLFFIRRNDSSTLYFGIFCFVIVLRLLSTGGRYLSLVLPGIPWEMMIKTEYITFYLAVPVFATFCHSLFPSEVSKRVLQAIQVVGIVFATVVLLTQAGFFSYLLRPYQLFTIACCLYGIYALSLALIRKRQGAYLFSLGFIVLFVTVLNDILYSQMIIRTGYFSPLGLFIFILFHAFLLSRHYAMAISTMELQSLEHRESNKALWQEINERKRAQEALQRANSIINRSPAVAFRWKNAEGWPVEFVSDNVMDLFGYSAEDFTSGQLSYAETIHPDDLDEVAAEVNSLIDDKDRSVLDHKPYRIISKDGKVLWLDDRTHVRRDADGDVTHFEGIVMDITASMQAARALRESKEKLARSRKMESLGLLAGGVAHDLNNVLTGIVSYPDVLLMKLPYNSPLREYVETIKSSGGRAVALVQDLITIARGVATPKEPLNMNSIINEYLNSNEFHHLKQLYSAITFTTTLDNQLFNINGSEVHINKAVMNIVLNAAEAIKDGGNITISTVNRYVDVPLKGYDDIRVGEYVVLSVSDDGSGISAVDLDRIFEPFYSRKVMGRSGTGLGLAVVWNVVQDHNGYIDVTTSEKGTTFELFFPITRDDIQARDFELPFDELRGNGQKVLVVDDEENQRDIAVKMLECFGYSAMAVPSGEAAIDYLNQGPVDLVVLDMIMDKGMDGRETYEAIIKVRPGQKAIIVSGFAESDDVKQIQKSGAGAFIKKPLTLESLGRAVKEEISK